MDASGEAYAVGHTPDTPLALANAAATLALIRMGTADRATRRPWLPLLAAGKATGDAAAGAWLLIEQLSQHRRMCGWCTLAAAATTVAAALTGREATRAWHHLRGRPA